MISDRYTLTTPQRFYGLQQEARPLRSQDTLTAPQVYVFDNQTGALAVCVNPPSVSGLQDFYGSFNITA